MAVADTFVYHHADNAYDARYATVGGVDLFHVYQAMDALGLGELHHMALSEQDYAAVLTLGRLLQEDANNVSIGPPLGEFDERW